MNQVIKIAILTVWVFVMLFGCSQKHSDGSQSTKNELLQRLELAKGKGLLFGHQDDLAYGIGWSYVDGESDVKRVAGDYPSLFGWELGGVESGHRVNLDSVPFQTIKDLAVKVHLEGGINTFSWHPFSAIDEASSWSGDSVVVKYIIPGGSFHAQFIQHLNRLADFLKQLKTVDGKAIPFIFRPWHEMDGTWFWWGSKTSSPDELKELFRVTVNYLRHEKGLTNMVVAYSPDRFFSNEEEYLTWYPGDDVIDIVGMDNYHDLKCDSGVNEVIKKLHVVIQVAKTHQKLAAFTETGCSNVFDAVWFTQKLGLVLNDSLINEDVSYVMVWRNASTNHFFFPYPGHAAESDAKAFLDRSDVLLLNEFVELGK